ncbi:MAG: FHA domain-containing protein, partial [Myxococcota bacterium]
FAEDGATLPPDLEEIAPKLGDEPEPSLEEVDPETADLMANAPAWLRKALEDEAAAAQDEADPDPGATEAPPVTPRAEVPDLPEVGDEVELTETGRPAADEPEAMVGPAIDGDAIDDTPVGAPDLPPPLPSPTSTDLDAAVVSDPAWMEFMSGPDRGVSVAVEAQLTIGQSELSGMSVPTDARLSPTHCIVQRTAEGFVLRDAGSTTGTVVNGQRITETVLTGGETIMVGRTVLRFRTETPDAH